MDVVVKLLLLCVIFVNEGDGSESKTTRNVLVTAADEKNRDPEGYAAIAELHRRMDDDQSGSIDRSESTDFLKEDLKIGGSDRARREKAFHHNNDDSITVDDLWEAWFESDERSWTTTELIQWLSAAVNLPQYADTFRDNLVTGIALPRIAVQNSSYLSNVLGIKNGVHRQKLQLKALDVVLFGYRDGTSRMKDVALAILLVLLTMVLIVFKKHKSRSKNEMNELSEKLSQLKNMENEFQTIQERFEDERKRKQSVSDSLPCDATTDVQSLRVQLAEAQQRLVQWEGGSFSSHGLAPLALQPLLRRTCELEMSAVAGQRAECVAEMHDAIEMVDRLRRKQTSLVSSLRLATGASAASATDHIDKRIFGLKSRMERIMGSMEECQQRWLEIESLCGFSITSTSPIHPPQGGPPSVTSIDSSGGPRHSSVASSFPRPERRDGIIERDSQTHKDVAGSGARSVANEHLDSSSGRNSPNPLPPAVAATDTVDHGDRISTDSAHLPIQPSLPERELSRVTLAGTSKKPSFSNLFRKK